MNYGAISGKLVEIEDSTAQGLELHGNQDHWNYTFEDTRDENVRKHDYGYIWEEWETRVYWDSDELHKQSSAWDTAHLIELKYWSSVPLLSLHVGENF